MMWAGLDTDSQLCPPGRFANAIAGHLEAWKRVSIHAATSPKKANPCQPS